MSLSSISNILDDATHDALDKQVNMCVEDDLKRPSIFSHTCILRTIVEYSNGTLDPKYGSSEPARELIMSHPGLANVLDVAWKSGSYRDIRNLAILQAPRRLITEADQPAVTDYALYKAFTSPYHGQAVDAFLKYLEHNNKEFHYRIEGNPSNYYGKFCSIVQSSGTGKSRLLFELRTKGVVVLYMNLRPSDDKTGFPARDDVPADILTPNAGSDAVDYCSRCCVFFAAVFTSVHKFLSAFRSLEDAIQQWNTSICNLLSADRKRFFATLKVRYEMYYKKIKGNPSRDAVTEINDKPSRLSISAEVEQMTKSMPGQKFMTRAYSDMVKSLDKLFSGTGRNKPKFVIALDEAQPLNIQGPEGYRPSTILCRAISVYSGADGVDNHSVWVVFASTALRMADFIAPRAYYDSARIPADGRLIYPPYCQLGWDARADPFEGTAATKVAQVRHIMGYGRALWKSLQELYNVQDIMDVAISKLSGTSENKNLSLVVLSQRVCLNITFGHHEAVEFVESAVASHLLVCIAITDDRNWSFTTYSSEPFLSCAAASLLHEEGNLDIFLKALEVKVLSRMIDVGKSGELASRLLWLLAKDLYVRRTPLWTLIIPAVDGQEWNSELADCQMTSVLEYFCFVFGDDFWDRAGKKAKKAFKNAFVNFSHWISMDENIWVSKNHDDQLETDEWTLRHWHRTSAVQCCHNQPLVDKMIPVYFDDRHGEDDLSRVSQIFISDRTQRRSSENELDKITRDHDSIRCHSSRPWVAILVDLGLKKSEAKVRFSHNLTEGPCLRIYAAAINVKTFPFLSRSERLPLTLRNIIAHERIPPNGRQRMQILQEQVGCGSSCTKSHMKWEAWAETSYSSQATGRKRQATDSSEARRKKRKA
ncbi:hypothetical protein EDD17DRAFT_1827054 [Pisolithus thermaeus]|nr:hypothetical protein EV401DRAFT_2073806 [Pisolithus croceorrhizus]KAI6161015.1 hypothetical protein EDD17DRAFT_1827054 [Pisolithus thermaeus]